MTYTTSAAISGTTAVKVYQSERYGTAFKYNIPLSNGKYKLRLHFSENYWTTAGARVFNVNVENGQGSLSNFDIFASAGAQTALVKEFMVSLTDSMLNVTLSSVKDKAKLSGIEIIPDSASTPPPATTSSTKINAAAVTQVINGENWVTDRTYAKDIGSYSVENSTTSMYGSEKTISNTSNPKIYQTERYGKSFGYQIPVPNGGYTIRFHFAELYWNSVGSRVFSVNIENGQSTLNNLDIVQQAGGNFKALTKDVKATVNDGVLDIAFTSTTDNAQVCAIELTPDSSVSQPVKTAASTRVNTGGSTVTAGGVVWNADQYFVNTDPNFPTATFSTTATIANTTAGQVYQTERYGTSFQYDIPVTNGSYQVRLHFAELYWSTAGQRVFSVNVENGQGLLNDLDIYAAAGKNTALVKTVNANVTDGKLTINFSSKADKAKISAIELIPVTSTVMVGITMEPAYLDGDSTLSVRIVPNPSAHRFTLSMLTTYSSPYDLRVTDAVGRVVLSRKGISEPRFSFGQNLRGGVYYVEVRQGKKRVVVRAIKQ